MSAFQDRIQAVDEPSSERTVLQRADHAVFFAAVDQPPAPTQKLKAAVARRRKTVESR